MLKDVNQYISDCIICKTNKGHQASMPVQPMSVPLGPFQHVCVDITGPLPITERGNAFLLVAIDRYTRYVEAWPMVEQTTKTVTWTFVNGWVCRHGIPMVVGSDRGSPFVSQLASNIYKELGIKRIKTTAYHPQSNGLVERFNKTLKYMLKVWGNENQDDWDMFYMHAVFSYNTLYHSLIQETPFFVTHGRDARLHVDIMTNNRREPTVGVYQYATELVQRLYDVHQRVKEILQNENDERVDKMTPLRELKIGEKVLLHDNTTKVGHSRKLTKRWKGPYTIIEKNSDVTYTIMNEKGTQLVSLHRLKLVGDEEKNNYLQHEEDLSMAELELTSINDTIQHLLTLKATKENEKLLLQDAIKHDSSVVDEDGKVIDRISIVDDVVDEQDNDLVVATPLAASSSSQHVNTVVVKNVELECHDYVTICPQQVRTLWL